MTKATVDVARLLCILGRLAQMQVTSICQNVVDPEVVPASCTKRARLV
ncbi:hypothetical protein SNOG_08256 [Parastagonospora nodorum SN15]|uniref:Uncharacterized protein n=1 Tax=Phaeosphaeria nodorum (strain SN15 / ATCC MYA-4574 / FGSC 10173) TaxID=321614 RepID=Q0UJ08_PHANO|nr:hypothetical protein SNOG_08256 [Parastagonospora nodorum SN15]EAT84532.1 hypothetical protein SNOG_08256 [Parastagonospora nodorum SN15]